MDRYYVGGKVKEFRFRREIIVSKWLLGVVGSDRAADFLQKESWR